MKKTMGTRWNRKRQDGYGNKRANFKLLKPRMYVWDLWYPKEWGQGKVVKIENNKIYVRYPYSNTFKDVEYDKGHVYHFLMRGNVDKRIKKTPMHLVDKRCIRGKYYE